jgi:(R,R)-butanediol dehydrogenase/meso-butanediol dehydrogenase/diacetyl reductase
MRHGRPNPLTGLSLPVILGHEFSGTVVEVNGSSELSPGDRVAVDGCIRCNECWYCRQGQYNLCDSLAILGFDAHGSHAELLSVPLYSVYRLPDSVSDEAGAFVEPLSVALHGARRARLAVGDSVVVVGAGMIGLCALQVAKAAGASQVVVLEPLESRRVRAQAMGATAVFDPTSENATELIRDLTGGIGADVALDCVGTESSLDAALNVTRKGGRIGVIGTFPVRPKVNMDLIGLEEREVYGSLAYADDFPRAIALLADGRADLSACVTSRITLEEIVEKGFLEMQRNPQDHIRIIVNARQ